MPQDPGHDRFYSGAESRAEDGLASATVTASGNGAAFETDDVNTIEATLAVSAASGTTPTLDVKLQTSHDSSTWVDVAAFAQQTTTQAGLSKVFGPLDAYGRWVWTVAGTTPSFTFSVTTSVKRAR